MITRRTYQFFPPAARNMTTRLLNPDQYLPGSGQEIPPLPGSPGANAEAAYRAIASAGRDGRPLEDVVSGLMCNPPPLDCCLLIDLTAAWITTFGLANGHRLGKMAGQCATCNVPPPPAEPPPPPQQPPPPPNNNNADPPPPPPPPPPQPLVCDIPVWTENG